MFLFSFLFPRLACAPGPIPNAALGMEIQRWRLDRQIHAEKEAQPLEVDLAVMPIGTDADNSKRLSFLFFSLLRERTRANCGSGRPQRKDPGAAEVRCKK